MKARDNLIDLIKATRESAKDNFLAEPVVIGGYMLIPLDIKFHGDKFKEMKYIEKFYFDRMSVVDLRYIKEMLNDPNEKDLREQYMIYKLKQLFAVQGVNFDNINKIIVGDHVMDDTMTLKGLGVNNVLELR